VIKATIIIPTRNRANYLSSSILSLTKQTYPASHFEIIIVDNGSTDNTKEISKKLISKYTDNRINYIYEPEPGLLSGRHRGAFEAKGDILIFIDDDIIAYNYWLS